MDNPTGMGPSGGTSTPVRAGLEAVEVTGLKAVARYRLRAAAGGLDSALGPLLALSLVDAAGALRGEDLCRAVTETTMGLLAQCPGAAMELATAAGRGFARAGDFQSAADLAELRDTLSLR